MNVAAKPTRHDQVAEHHLLEEVRILDIVRARPEHDGLRRIVDANLALAVPPIIDQRRHREKPAQHLERAEYRRNR